MNRPVRHFFAGSLLLAAAIFICLRPGQARAAETLKFASYNLENYLPADRLVDGKMVPGTMKPESEIAAAVKTIAAASPELLLLIEMGEPDRLEDLRGRLRAAGIDYPHSVWVKGADPQRHIALLSKFPIVSNDSADEIPFELEGKPRLLARGLLDATVEPRPGFRMRILGAHLKSKREVAGFDQAQFRAREALLIRSRMEKILAENPAANLLLAGDLNETKNEFPVRELIGAPGSPTHMADIWLKDSRGERWTHFWKSADLYSRIDYILASPALFRSIDREASGILDPPNWNDASDHRLIYATIRLPEADGN